MLELGKHTEEAHRNIGTLVKKVVDILFVVGPSTIYKDGCSGGRYEREKYFRI